EDEAAFSRLCDFVEEIQFDRMGAFAYSPEDDTPAAQMPNAVPEEVKAERLDRLMRIQQRIALARNALRVGQIARVLCEGEQSGRFVGRSKLEAPEGDGKILFTAGRPVAPGEFVSMRLTRALPYDLEGECV
ncbi:MAG TPA: 30S ribosomal protein S12 methylthiotransferase RimO, partial [Clostridia bacterium]|nr:30S ribosomal protein S12 methylthiotransferase RimO [Clostridia bacterium]